MSLRSTFLFVAPVLVSAKGAWRDDFHKANTGLFTAMKGLRHCDDVCFEADDSMMSYGADLGGGRKGLIVSTRSDLCDGCSNPGDQCYDTNTSACAPFASQYLMSADPVTGKGNHYTFGDYEVSMRSGHLADGSAAAGTFSCFTPGTTPAHGDTDPLHNELALCFDGANATQVKFLYWYNQTLQKTIVDLGFDSSAKLHTYGVAWRQDKITWSVDGKVAHVDEGIPGKTIPWEPTVMVVGLLKPHGATAPVSSSLHVEYVSYKPLKKVLRADGIHTLV